MGGLPEGTTDWPHRGPQAGSLFPHPHRPALSSTGTRTSSSSLLCPLKCVPSHCCSGHWLCFQVALPPPPLQDMDHTLPILPCVASGHVHPGAACRTGGKVEMLSCSSEGTSENERGQRSLGWEEAALRSERRARGAPHSASSPVTPRPQAQQEVVCAGAQFLLVVSQGGAQVGHGEGLPPEKNLMRTTGCSRQEKEGVTEGPDPDAGPPAKRRLPWTMSQEALS